LFILEVRGVVDIGGESGLLFILEVRGVVDIGGERGLLLLILEMRVG
jgi:hypothetical protein